MNLLTLENVSKSFTERMLFDHISLGINEGDKIGVIGINGTGKSAAVDGFSIAGKTGSAEGNEDGHYLTHAWFVGYIDDPAYPYAVCVFVEKGESGGSVAAPIAGEIFRWLTEK